MATKKAAPAKKSVSSREGGSAQRPTAQRRSGQQQKTQGPAEIAKLAAQQLLQLTGRVAEGVTALERTDEGWRVEIEVLETRRIPDTTDRLALYEVEVDESGNMVGYSRTRRYVRGREDGEGR